ncbi:amino acid ABC transporter permease [Ereboglobus luteus]|uniref:Glutamate/aspartate import permease protein GltK n=1 Tax=Ereboglobus luteus TaxID=1796921 RepID=A0A2U8E044_9BACT|nr:amino acid ABC transporter permease [Ereboglobus luteus]AWI08206.1 ABC transporter permease [Ereboglobus luteus]
MTDIFNEIWPMMPQLARGAVYTLLIAFVGLIGGLVLGFFIALGKISKNPILRAVCGFYTWFIRGTPLLMQLCFIYFVLPKLIFHLRYLDALQAALIAFSLNSAAYLAEMYRSAIQSIDKGQYEAAHALGLTYWQTMGRIIIPQSIRRLVPQVGNEIIMLLKDTSVVAFIGLTDLMKITSQIQSSGGKSLVYLPSALIYLIMTTLFTYIFSKIEERHAKYE